LSIWTIHTALEWTTDHFSKAGEHNPRLVSQQLLAYATGLSRLELYLDYERPLSVNERATLREAIKRRDAHEPLQYIMGYAPFRHLELIVRSPVLIPRPETEMLVELVLDELVCGGATKAFFSGDAQENAASFRTSDANAVSFRTSDANAVYLEKTTSFDKPKVLDVGTGTGCIALSLLHEHPCCLIVATDNDACALELAKDNAQLLEKTQSNRVTFLLDDLATSLLTSPQDQKSFDVVVSNPPYIPSDLIDTLPCEVRYFENKQALDGGVDGLRVFELLSKQATRLLKPGGLLACELHEQCLDSAANILSAMAYNDIVIHNDLTERQRFITARNCS
jgi:release factor glutamine methyltransferase